jgi:hypothetical protein
VTFEEFADGHAGDNGHPFAHASRYIVKLSPKIGRATNVNAVRLVSGIAGHWGLSTKSVESNCAPSVNKTQDFQVSR